MNENTAYNYNNAVNDNVVNWPKGGKVKQAKSFISSHKVEIAAGSGLLAGLVGGSIIGAKYSNRKWFKKAKEAGFTTEAFEEFLKGQEFTEKVAEG